MNDYIHLLYGNNDDWFTIRTTAQWHEAVVKAAKACGIGKSQLTREVIALFLTGDYAKLEELRNQIEGNNEKASNE